MVLQKEIEIGNKTLVVKGKLTVRNDDIMMHTAEANVNTKHVHVYNKYEFLLVFQEKIKLCFRVHYLLKYISGRNGMNYP